jgi:serine/threonine protein kinase
MTFDLSHARWLAPEYNKSASFHFPTEEPDVWSFGILCLEVFTGEDPYNSHSDFAAHTLLREGIIPEYPGSTAVGLSSRVWEIMQCCWRIDPDERPSISEIKLAIEALIPSHVCEWFVIPIIRARAHHYPAGSLSTDITRWGTGFSVLSVR